MRLYMGKELHPVRLPRGDQVRCVLVLEDTESGVTLDGSIEHNGVADNATTSLAFLLLANTRRHLEYLQKIHTLQVIDENDTTH